MRPPGDARGGVVKVLRRAIVAVIITGAVAAAMRVRGRGGVPPQTGGWQELPIGDKPS